MAQLRTTYSPFFVDPSMLAAIVSVIDLGGTLIYFNTAPTPEQADLLALQYDWFKVGQDLQYAMNTYKQSELSTVQQMELAGIAAG